MLNAFSDNNISIDASTICQLKCPECSTTKGLIKNGIIGSGFLRFENFKKFILQNPQIEIIELSNWGEIFLNPEIIQIVKYAFESKVKLTAGNGVNFNMLSKDTIEAVVKYQFGYINISIDGASQETYIKYRVGGNFNSVINNIIQMNLLKATYKSIYPKLAWQFILFGHNEHEIPSVKRFCKELNMEFNPKLNHSNFAPLKNPEYVKLESGLGYSNREEYRAIFHKNYKRPCCQLWYSPQINWDGKLIGCCVNKWVAFGNVFKEGLSNCLESILFKNTKLTLQGKLEVTEKMPCFYCSTFKQTIDQPITDAEIISYSEFIHPAERQ